MGRAGRMGPGHCYRLYSSAVFANDFPDFAQPQILQKPVEDILLQMKCMNIDNVVNFPFPTRPSLEALMSAEKKLIMLGALDDSQAREARFVDIKKTEFSSKPTPLGVAMSKFPVSPRCAKMIVQSTKEALPHVITLVSTLTVREMFLENVNSKSKKGLTGSGERKLLGDFLAMLKAVQLAESFNFRPSKCTELGVRCKSMMELDKMRKQLIIEINKNKKSPYSVDERRLLKKPTQDQCKTLRQLLLAAFPDHVAKRLPNGEVLKRSKENPNEMKKVRIKNAYECKDHEGPVYIGTDSVLRGQHPEFLIYKELYEGNNNKMYMRDVAVVDSSWLSND